MFPEVCAVRILVGNRLMCLLTRFTFVTERSFKTAFHELITGLFFTVETFIATGIDEPFHL